METAIEDEKNCIHCLTDGRHQKLLVSTIGIIGVLSAHIIAFIVFIDRMDARIEKLEAWQMKNESVLNRVPADIEWIKNSLERLERNLDHSKEKAP